MSEQNLIFRKYAEPDLPAMKEINHKNHIDQGGALFGKLYNDKNYFVVEKDGAVIAYVNVLEELPDRVRTSTIFEPLPESGIYIKQVAVADICQKQGVGSFLYKQLFGIYKDQHIFSHVFTQNWPSTLFHFRSGFKIAGMFSAKGYFGVENYVAFLMGRRT